MDKEETLSSVVYMEQCHNIHLALQTELLHLNPDLLVATSQ